MKKEKKSNETFDPNGNYTGKYIKENKEDLVTVPTAPEQDADDL